MESKWKEIKFTDADVIKGDFIPKGEYNPYKIHPFLFHDHGFVICVVFASNLQEALDEAVDNDKLDKYMIDLTDKNDRDDYLVKDVVTPGFDKDCPEWTDPETDDKYWWREEMQPAFLGNASQPFDIESIGIEELPNPPFSFCALFNTRNEK